MTVHGTGGKFQELGIPSLGLAYITTRDLAATRPELVRRFLAAALRGIDDAVRDPAAAVEITMRHAVGEDPAHQRYMLPKAVDLAAVIDDRAIREVRARR